MGQTAFPLNSFYDELCTTQQTYQQESLLQIVVSDRMVRGKEVQYTKLQRWDFDFAGSKGGGHWWHRNGTNCAGWRLHQAAAWLRRWAWAGGWEEKEDTEDGCGSCSSSTTAGTQSTANDEMNALVLVQVRKTLRRSHRCG